MDQDEFDDVMRSFLSITQHMDSMVDELRLINGRLETRLEQHDQVLDRHERTLGNLDKTLTNMDKTLATIGERQTAHENLMRSLTTTLTTISDRMSTPPQGAA